MSIEKKIGSLLLRSRGCAAGAATAPDETDEDSPDESGDGEHGVVRSIGDDDPFQIRWQTTTCPMQKRKKQDVGFRRKRDSFATYACSS